MYMNIDSLCTVHRPCIFTDSYEYGNLFIGAHGIIVAFSLDGLGVDRCVSKYDTDNGFDLPFVIFFAVFCEEMMRHEKPRSTLCIEALSAALSSHKVGPLYISQSLHS